jgi:predicted DNA-binding transcriptional regulator AlpA
VTPEEHRKDQQQRERRRLLDGDDRVLTFKQWCDLNSLSPATGRRILKSGDGPKSVQLSPRRIGISLRANREWLAARAR